MQALIDFVMRYIAALWPVVCVREWETALMVRNGHIRQPLGPGLHWRWWFIEEVKRWPAVEVALDLDTAGITSTDGVSFVLSANIGYRLVDISQSWRSLWNMESTMKKTAIGIIATSCSTYSWSGLCMSRESVEYRLLTELNQLFGSWGLQVTRVHLTDLIQGRAHRQYLDGALVATTR